MYIYMRTDNTCETIHQSIGAGFDIYYYTGDWFNTPLYLYLSSPPVVSVYSVLNVCNVCNGCAGFKRLCVLKVRNVHIIIYWFYTPSLLWEYLKLPPHETTPPTASPSRISLVRAADLVGAPTTLSRNNTVRARLDA